MAKGSILKELLKESYGSGVVVPVIKEQVIMQGAIDRRSRKHDVLHPSEVSSDFCGRHWLLIQKNPELYYGGVSQSDYAATRGLIFGVGSAVHELIQNILAPSRKLFGFWNCSSCHRFCRTLGFYPKPDEKCEARKYPHQRKLEYEELKVDHSELMIGGHTDGVFWADGKKYIFEFKTMRHDYFSTLLEPLESHKLQAGLYQIALEKAHKEMYEVFSDCSDTDPEVLEVLKAPFEGVCIVYMDKDEQKLKEYVVRLNESSLLGGGPTDVGQKVYGLIEELKEVGAAHKEGRMLPRICGSRLDPRAKKCSGAAECFSLDD